MVVAFKNKSLCYIKENNLLVIENSDNDTDGALCMVNNGSEEMITSELNL